LKFMPRSQKTAGPSAAAPQTESAPSAEPAEAAVSFRAALGAAALMAAGWVAAGSTGLMAQPLRHVLAVGALAVAAAAAWPRREMTWETWLPAALAGVAAVVLGALGGPAVDVLAVALVAAAIAGMSAGLDRRVILPAAASVAVLGAFRLAVEAIPTVWSAADALGGALGRLGGLLAGRPLRVGATFGGVDFLVAMTAFWALWVGLTAPPRRARAIYAALAILVAQAAYLVVLASTDRLLAAFPRVPLPEMNLMNDRTSRWIATNAVRTLLPWNLPVVAVVLHSLVVGAMVRWADWLPSDEPPAAGQPGQPAQRRRDAGATRNADTAGRAPHRRDAGATIDAGATMGDAGPLYLALGIAAVCFALASMLSALPGELEGKTILAYEEGYFSWQGPTHDRVDLPGERTFGMLSAYVESLGGKLERSEELSEAELGGADVLVLIHPDRPWPDDRLQRVIEYVRGGGSLLVLAEPKVREGLSHSSFNEVLRPTSMAVRYDSAVPATEAWEDSYFPLAHPATAGVDVRRNRFGFGVAASIDARWPARPLLVGRHGWSEPGSDAVMTGAAAYVPGHRLGDLVLAAEEPLGAGRVVVLGDIMPLTDDGNVTAFPFTGRLLGYLAGGSWPAQPWWRQAIATAAFAAFVGLLLWRPEPLRLGFGALVLATAALAVAAIAQHAGRVLPDGRLKTPNNVAYITGSHLEAPSDDPWSPLGLGRFQRTLMRNGWLPLLAPDLDAERLERAGLVVSIAPAKAFSPAERAAVGRFVEAGGTLLTMVGAHEAGPSSELLAEYHLRVPPSPIPPSQNVREPKPLGAYPCGYQVLEDDEGEYEPTMRFYAAWPVEGGGRHAEVLMRDPDNIRLIIRQPAGAGSVVLVGDTYLAVSENLAPSGDRPSENEVFWRWFLSRITRRPEWRPPRPPQRDEDDYDDSEEAEDSDDPIDAMFDEGGLIEPDESGLIEPQEGALIEPEAGGEGSP
jgi:hypothetical protein